MMHKDLKNLKIRGLGHGMQLVCNVEDSEVF